MIRSGILLLVAMTTIDAASGADQQVFGRARHPHYKYRTVITERAVIPRGPFVYRNPDLLFTPLPPYVPPLIRAPLLPGYATLSGYYGPANSYYYPGPQYVGPEISYWDQLPYACAVYGYC
jgi:hypothetical protein